MLQRAEGEGRRVELLDGEAGRAAKSPDWRVSSPARQRRHDRALVLSGGWRSSVCRRHKALVRGARCGSWRVTEADQLRAADRTGGVT